MIQARELTKRYGTTTAVNGLTFDVLPGRVTGFLGPNGAGKSTTLRLIMGLDRPTSGTVTIDGQPYDARPRPLWTVGAVLDAKAIHPGRTAYHHLLAVAQSNGIPSRRIDEVLDVVGLTGVAHHRTGGFSLGMAQRLGIGTALLGDPDVLVLDEPVNGLDPEGILWIRNLMRSLASEGRTVLVSSHLISEMALTADHVIVIGRGRIITQASVAELVATSSHNYVRVRSPQQDRLAGLLRADGMEVSETADVALAVKGTEASTIGELAARHGIPLHELAAEHASLEEAFMDLTHDSVEFRATERKAA